MTTSSPTVRRSPSALRATVAGVFGLFYAYAVWTAVAFLVAQATAVEGLTGAGWAFLLFPVVFPIIVFVAGVVLGRRRPLLHLAAILLVGLGLVGVFWLNVLTFAITNGNSLFGS
ncbi:hypothetical protein Q9S78_10590 [Microbacterium sp. KSW-18]|uniref:Bacitracin resistance protein n=1 Tax=Microbacterium aquilitoris TaxID=3067307 RepID=A0ABU3GK89_9MICO|nr:hypothetical protein [Microbacterium sp. KSW-18]MDT3331120.1 hypothetical protein [Microbacterium sp. KSW-18]